MNKVVGGIAERGIAQGRLPHYMVIVGHDHPVLYPPIESSLSFGYLLLSH